MIQPIDFRRLRGVEPYVHPVDQVLRQLLPIVFHEGNPAPQVLVLGKLKNPLQDSFPRVIRRMGLAREDNLQGPPGIV